MDMAIIRLLMKITFETKVRLNLEKDVKIVAYNKTGLYLMNEIALCDNPKCHNYRHITTVEKVHDGWDWDYARGIPLRFEVFKSVSGCCGSEDIIEKDIDDLTDREYEELEVLECQ